jgi:hypothetical protein
MIPFARWLPPIALCVLPALFTGCDGSNISTAPQFGVGPAGNDEYRAPGLSQGGADLAELASRFCGRVASCGLMDPDEIADCEEDALRGLVLVIDEAHFVSCFEAIPCEALSDGDVFEQLQRCLALDLMSFRCEGGALSYCTETGVCEQVTCADACALIGEQDEDCVQYGPVGLCACMVSRDYDPAPVQPGGQETRRDSANAGP